MIGPATALLASQTSLPEETYRGHFAYVIREVAERGGHGFHGANEFGDVELSAAYMRARREGYIDPVRLKGFRHFLQFMGFYPAMKLTESGWRAYGEIKASETRGDIEPNRYYSFLGG